MITVTHNYGDKKFNLEPYNTAQEKELLLLSMISEPSLDNALSICGVNNETIKSLSESEKIVMLYKYRTISIGDEINLKFKCKYCDSGNENFINVSGIMEEGNISNELITDRYKDLNEDNFQDFVNKDGDELELDEYEELYDEVLRTCTTFDFRKPIICQKCGKTNFVDIDSPEFVIDNMSEDDMMSLYQTYNNLVFFGKYTKQDVDSLYPFERSIVISILTKTREELNK
jgi:hypothetical protein